MKSPGGNALTRAHSKHPSLVWQLMETLHVWQAGHVMISSLGPPRTPCSRACVADSGTPLFRKLRHYTSVYGPQVEARPFFEDKSHSVELRSRMHLSAGQLLIPQYPQLEGRQHNDPQQDLHHQTAHIAAVRSLQQQPSSNTTQWQPGSSSEQQQQQQQPLTMVLYHKPPSLISSSNASSSNSSAGIPVTFNTYKGNSSYAKELLPVLFLMNGGNVEAAQYSKVTAEVLSPRPALDLPLTESAQQADNALCEEVCYLIQSVNICRALALKLGVQCSLDCAFNIACLCSCCCMFE